MWTRVFAALAFATFTITDTKVYKTTAAAQPRNPTQSGQAPPKAPPLPSPVPLRQAFFVTAVKVLDGVRSSVGGRATLLIDPLIDGKSGAQSVETQ